MEWVAFPFTRGSSQHRIELRSPALQVDSLPSEPSGKPMEESGKYKITHTYIYIYIRVISVAQYKTGIHLASFYMVIQNPGSFYALYHLYYIFLRVSHKLLCIQPAKTLKVRNIMQDICGKAWKWS